MNKTEKEMHDLLTSVGAETFVTYYRVFEAEKNSKKNDRIRLAFKKDNEKWIESSTNTKASAGKMIFVKGYEKEILFRIVYESTKLNQKVIDMAIEVLESIVKEEIDAIEALPIEIETEKMGLVKLRIQQSIYRKMVIDYWQMCAITNCKNHSLLIASHIKSWKESANLEKIDPYNGILLSPLYDKLFDRHLISFNDNGFILVSNQIKEEDLIALDIKASDRLNPDKIHDNHKKYLAHHRAIFNLKNIST